MAGGTAEGWVANQIEEANEVVPLLDNAGIHKKDDEGEYQYYRKGFPSWVEFEQRLIKTFEGVNIKQEAQLKLSRLHQEKKTVEEFFQDFDSYQRTAGYQIGHDSYLIELLEQALNFNILSTIYNSEALPKTYDEFKARATQIDSFRRRLALTRPAPS